MEAVLAFTRHDDEVPESLRATAQTKWTPTGPTAMPDPIRQLALDCALRLGAVDAIRTIDAARKFEHYLRGGD